MGIREDDWFWANKLKTTFFRKGDVIYGNSDDFLMFIFDL